MAKRPSNPDAERTEPKIKELPLVALRETVIFPEMIVPLQVGREKSVAALNAAVDAGSPIALVTQHLHGEHHIFDHRQVGNELEGLEDKTEIFPPEVRKLLDGKLVDSNTVDHYLPV